MWKKTQINCILIASNFVIHIHILIFLVFKIVNLSPHWLQIKFLMSVLFYLFTFVICLWHWKFVTADVTLYLKEYTAKRLTDEFPEKRSTKRGVNKLFKSCGTQAQLSGGQAVADHAVSAPKKTLSFFFWSSRILPLTSFCRLSGEVTENTFTFSPIKNTRSVVYCGNFWSRRLACFMQAAQFVSVSSCARRLLKHFRCKSLQIIWVTDDRWIPVSRDISRTVLWDCDLSSWLRTKSLTVSTFSSVRAQTDGKSK